MYQNSLSITSKILHSHSPKICHFSAEEKLKNELHICSISFILCESMTPENVIFKKFPLYYFSLHYSSMVKFVIYFRYGTQTSITLAFQYFQKSGQKSLRTKQIIIRSTLLCHVIKTYYIYICKTLTIV
jgi:hypothetical protein